MFARFMLTKITAMDSEQENTAPQGPPPPDAIKKPDLPPPSLPKPSIPDATSSEPISSGPPVLTPPPPKPEPTPPTVVEEALPPGSIAPLNPRLIAFLIDALIGIGILLVVGTVIPGLSRVGALAMLVYIATRDALPFLKGQSIGKMLTGLRIVKMDGHGISFGTVILRNFVGYAITALTAGLGFLLSMVGSNGRALHDLVAGTIVVYARKRVR